MQGNKVKNDVEINLENEATEKIKLYLIVMMPNKIMMKQLFSRQG